MNRRLASTRPASFKRILAAALLAIATFALAACADLNGTLNGLLSNQLNFGPALIQQALNSEFPKDYKQMGGLVSLGIRNPRLSIPAGGSRLRVDFDLAVNNKSAGSFGVSSGVRFDAGTLGIYMEQPAIENLAVPALGGALGGNARNYVNQWLADYSRNEPVYRLTSQQLGGRKVSSATIANGQVLLNLAQADAGSLLQSKRR